MLLALRSLWEEQAGVGEVIVDLTGIEADAAIGNGTITAEKLTGGHFVAVPKPRRRPREEGYFVPVPRDIAFSAPGVTARPRIGRGSNIIDARVALRGANMTSSFVGEGAVEIGIELFDDEIVALLLAA
jgi:hypothetical protein